MDGGDATTLEHTRRRLVVVSNRGPVVYGRGEVGRSARRGGGGLVTALSGLVPAHDVTWVATAISDEDRVVALEQPGAVEETDRSGNRFRLRLVHVDRAEYDRYYNVYANPHLWFIQHGLWNHPYTPELNAGIVQAWHSYRHVNERIAEAAASEAELVGADVVLVQDYQLYLVPRLLRSHGLSAPVSHFTHIPWPGSDAWRSARREAREAIIAGLLGANVVGFHTRRSARNFLAACEDYLSDCHVDYRRSDVEHEGRTTRVRAYPISVDPLEFDALAEDSRVREASATLLEAEPERLILRVDRTDPSKNIVRGFTAFGRFLEQHPEWHRRVLMLALLDPSRQEIPEYAEYLGAVHRAARSVNDAYGGDGWNPIDLRVSDNFPRAVAAYKRYDVLLVNALVDGMNLIAKEAPLVNERDGVVILSENAGAHEELGRHALTVNPFDVEETAAAIEAALVMPQPERAARAAAIRDHVRTHDVRVWISSQLRDLERRGAGAR